MDNFYAEYPPEGSGTGGVTSLNTQTGDITLVAGTNITIVPGAGTLTINAAGGTAPQVELRTITAPEAAAKSLTLAGAPTFPLRTILTIASAPGQFYGDDFIVTGAVLSWAGLDLDGILDTGDRLTIFYI